MDDVKLYVSIWTVLVLFTLLEVVALIFGFSYIVALYLIILLAGGKAIMIALYYQHLRYESTYLVLIPAFALAMLIVLIVVSIAGVL